jgi:hypothetical protein
MMNNRRDLLKGLSLGSGAVLLSPFLKNMAMAAGDNPKFPKRFVFVVKSSGLEGRGLVPVNLAGKTTVSGGVKTTSLEGATLNKTLQALDPFKDQVSIVRNTSGRMVNVGHTGSYGALGVYNHAGVKPPMRATIDGLLGNHFPSVFNHLGLKMDPGSQVAYPALSASGRNRQLHYRCSPETVYSDLFASVASNEEVVKKFRMSGNVLDHVAEDIRKVRKELDAANKEQLDHYLDSFETLKKRREKLIGMKDHLGRYAPEITDKYTSKIGTHQLEAHFELASAALISGLTNVVSFCCDDLLSDYAGLGFQAQVHSIGHGSGFGELSSADLRDMIRQFHVEQIAKLAGDLKKVPEGDGTMLDNTVIVYLSDNGDRHHAGGTKWPMVIVGGMNNRLELGNYIEYPDYKEQGHKTIGNIFTSIVHAAGIETDHFGNIDPALSHLDQEGPLTELMAG